MIREDIERILYTALKELQTSGDIPAIPAFIQVDLPKNSHHGDFCTNVAMILAKLMRVNPLMMANKIMQQLPAVSYLQKVVVASPGFINFFLSLDALQQTVVHILNAQHTYGRSTIGRGKRILVEYVSSNPTGPLHVGHGRHAAYGSVICCLLDAVGFKPYSEYYVNDTGRQMDILTVSIWLRYLALFNQPMPFPANAYQGAYIIDIAQQLQQTHHADFCRDIAWHKLPAYSVDRADSMEIYIDALIQEAKSLLGQQFLLILNHGLAVLLEDIRNDLAEFGVHFNHWFSERAFVNTGRVASMLNDLAAQGYSYTAEGAVWFCATKFGDDKDRVLVRRNGETTYFANDLAYHLNKFERGFDLAINIMGADHHGYIPRVKAGLQACGIQAERLVHLLGQFVTLYREGYPVAMSTRAGEFITLRQLREEVGSDVARFFYVMRKYEQPIDFDIDVAKLHSNDNPFFYLQYAYARICSVFRQVNQLRGDTVSADCAYLHLLTTPEEKQLLVILMHYPKVIEQAALHYEPHLLINYLRHVATDFHAYYSTHQFIVEDEALCHARLALIAATRQVLLNGLGILGVQALEVM